MNDINKKTALPNQNKTIIIALYGKSLQIVTL